MTRMTTKRLILRAGQDDDLGPLFSVYSDPRAMRFWSTPPHASPDETQSLLDRLSKLGDRLYFVVEYQGIAVGTCGIHEGSEIGFILHPDQWRKGIMSEAARAVITHVWATTTYTEITADIDPRNTASQGILTALGFTQTSYAKDTFFINGEWSDSAYFTLYRDPK